MQPQLPEPDAPSSRRRVGGRLEWDVTITEQGERDQYDDLHATYILAISADQKVCRLRAHAACIWPNDSGVDIPATAGARFARRSCRNGRELTLLPRHLASSGEGREPRSGDAHHVRRHHRMVDDERLQRHRHRDRSSF